MNREYKDFRENLSHFKEVFVSQCGALQDM